jgi:predicted enzyme related to lactoylglutathione lyase
MREKMTIKRVSFSWVGVNDFQKAKDFFCKTLGLKISDEQAEFGWMELCGPDRSMVMGVGKASDQMPAGINAVIMFVVDHYDQTKKDLAKKGIQFFGEIAGIPQVPRMVCFKDPDGNIFQLVEETPGMTDAH